MGHPTAKTNSATRTRKSPPRPSKPARRHNAVQVSPPAVPLAGRITNSITEAFTLGNIMQAHTRVK